MFTGLSEITVRTDIARGIKAITENRIHLNRRKTHLGCHDIGFCLFEYRIVITFWRHMSPSWREDLAFVR